MRKFQFASKASASSIVLFGVVIASTLLLAAKTDFVEYFENTISNQYHDIRQSIDGKSDIYNNSSFAPCLMGNMGGTVFNDINADGIDEDAGGVEAVQVQIFSCNSDGSSTLLETVFTDENGEYQFSSSSIIDGEEYRIEFSNLPYGFTSSLEGSDNGTQTQFVNSISCEVNYGVYDTNACQMNPLVIVPCYINGTSTAQGGNDALVTFNYDGSGGMSALASGSEIGATWGVAYDDDNKTLYVSEVLKRHSGTGSGGLGQIYSFDYSSGSPGGVMNFVNVPDVGTVTRDLANSPGSPSADGAAFSAIGRVGIGDIEVSQDGKELYVMNLAQSRVDIIDVASNSVSGSITFPSIGCTIRPWALKMYGGNLYAGAVCEDALEAYVFQANGSTFSIVDLDINTANDFFDLSYQRESAWSLNPTFNGSNQCNANQLLPDAATWHTWIDTWPSPICANPFGDGDDYVIYPQPILSDIEFDQEGSITLGFTDRMGLQGGFLNQDPDGNGNYVTIGAGDIIKICNTGTGFSPEGSAGCPFTDLGDDAGYSPFGGAVNATLDDGMEFYNGDDWLNSSGAGEHYETALGALAFNNNANGLVAAVFDPINGTFNAGGVKIFNPLDGSATSAIQIYGSGDVGTFAKAVGLGDLELICDPPRVLQLGNYAWFDTNGDGVQDPCELPIAGLTVKLYTKPSDGSNSELVATTLTDADGQYYFTDDADADEMWEAGFTSLEKDSSYYIAFCGDDFDPISAEVEIGGLSYELTQLNSGMGENPDLNDSDAEIIDILGISELPAICVLADTINHTLGLGLNPLPVSIGDTVFVDVNYNGIQDDVEPGIDGVTVTLFDAVTGNQITEDIDMNPIAPIQTVDGRYKFENLPAGSYYVEFDVTTNIDGIVYAPTLENANGGTLDADDSDVDAFGRSDTTTLVLGQMDCTLDAGYIIPGKIGDTVFVDNNMNGIQDLGDGSIAGVKVTLLDDSDTPVTQGAFGPINPMTTTDATGMYMFGDLLPGTYKVKFDVSMLPGEYVYTLEGNGTLEEIDSNVPSGPGMMGMGQTSSITIGSGDTIPNIDAGIVECMVSVALVPTMDACILPGGAPNPIVATPSGGLSPYTYLWSTTETTMTIAPTPTVSTTYSVTVTDALGCTAEESVTLISCSSIGNKVFYDANQDGQQDPDEPGVPGIVTYLLDKDMNRVPDPMNPGIDWSITTDANGMYLYDNIQIDIIDPTGDTFFVEFVIDESNGTKLSPVQDPDVNSGMVSDTDTDSDVNSTPFGDGFKSGEIVLLPDMALNNIDAGIMGNDTIGDFVFIDSNGNGIQEEGEPGIENVTVYLKINGIIVDDTTTNTLGKYVFENLIPNPAFEYSIQFENPVGLYPTLANQGGDDTVDSDADPAMMLMTTGITFAGPDLIDTSFDAGFFAPVSIGDTVFVDANGNGLQDIGEVGIENVTVSLFKVDDMGGVTSITTDLDGNPLLATTVATGRYKFENLAPGNYFVNFDVTTASGGANLVATIENVNGVSGDPDDSDVNAIGDSDTISVASGNMDCTLDAGYFLPVSIGDTVFVDNNGNGLQDIGETGIPNVLVYLYKINDMNVGVLQTVDYINNPLPTMTDAQGRYKFENLTPGQYYVEFDVNNAGNLTNYFPTYDNINGGSNDANDSDISEDGEMLSDTTAVLTSGEMDCTLDAGFFEPVAIGDTTFVDANLNGIQDPGEPGLPGVEVTIFYYNPDTMNYVQVMEDLNGDPVIPLITDDNGYYKFENLPPGEYFVQFDAMGIPLTLEDQGTDDAVDSDANTDGLSDTLVVLSTDVMNCTFDAGYQGLDYGDLPDSYVTADSTNMNNAPKHVMRDGKYMGSLVDLDFDGGPTADGSADDETGSLYTIPANASGDDEDGIEFLSPMIPGNVAYIKLTYTAPDGPTVEDAYLNAWIDFDGDGTFTSADAVNFTQIDASDITPTSNLGLPAAGTEAMVILTFEVPETAVFANGNAYARFRYSCDGGLAPNSGLALDGEIEDYVVPLAKVGNYVWLDADFDGIQDPIDADEMPLQGVNVVLSYDTTANGQPINIVDTVVTDVNGLYSFCGLLASDGAKYQLTLITPDGFASTMMNIGDDELDSDADILVGVEGRDSIQTEPFMIMDATDLPTNEVGINDDPNMVGTFPDNQVDQTYDFGLVVLDFGDLPEDHGDLPINFSTDEDGNVDPPKHIVTTNKRLGMCVDSEPDGQPDPMGMGDDDNMASGSDEQFAFGTCDESGDDEDGIEFLTPLIPGDTAYIKVTYTLPPGTIPNRADGYLNAWIDFDGNGLLLNGANLGPNSDDRVKLFETTGFAAGIQRPDFPLQAGNDVMKILGFEVPETATFNGGTVFSRFRLSCEGRLLPVGILQDGSIPEGEVEDYVVPLTKIGNLVWLDQNYDGIQDTSAISVEEGIPNIPVSLTYTYVDTDNDIDLTIQVDTITDEEGKYSFCGLLPTDIGEYKITVISPEYMTPTIANNPTVSDSLDSDQVVNMGDSIVMTDIFQITTSTGLPLMEDGLEDDPNELGTFPDSLFDQTFDFGFVPLDYGDLDSTYLTAIEDGGPVHVISEDKYLGQSADAEITAAVDSIAGAIGDGDDNAPGLTVPSSVTISDDEDGVQFITPLIPGFKATIRVDYTLAEEDGFLNGWIDFNGNGTLETEEALEFYTDTQLPSTDGALAMGSAQTIELCFDVPEDAVYNEGDVHARFRLSCEGGLTPVGGFAVLDPTGPQAPQGEVEDYFVPLAKIGNLAFFDNDLDGSQDGNSGVNPEIGIEGVNNTLTFAGFGSMNFDDGDEIEYPVTTDANGNYYVCGLIEGEYNLVPTKYEDDAETPEDTIPVRYILTAANCDPDDDLDSDFAPNVQISIPNLLFTDLALDEDGFTDVPGGEGFPDEQDQVNFDQGWIPEPNIEAIANIAGVDYPQSGQCRNFNVIADICIQNTGFVEMNGELIGARLENIDIEINLGEQFMGAFVGVVGDPIILDTVEYEEAFMLIDDEDAPNENPDFDGNDDIDGSLMDGILEPSEIVCLRIMFEISPDELSDEDAMNLQFNAVVSGMAINNEGKELPDFFNGGAQFVAVDSSDRVFMFDGTYDDPNEPEPLTDCYETTKDLSVNSLINLSFDEECMAMITPQMILTKMDEDCDNDDYPLGGYYRLQLEDLNGNVIIPYTDSLILDDPMFIGNMYNVAVQTVSESCNSAWGKVTIENKFPPEILCANDTITCGELLVLAPPVVLNNCGEINLKMINRTTMDVACEDPNLQLIITETWVATDPNGLRADTCTQTLSVEKFDINDVVGPMTTDTTINCSNGIMPAPSELGVPTLNGVDLFPDNFAECGIFVSFEDEFFSFGNDCTSGVQRTWTVQNWICGTDNSETFTQLITFIDTTGPVLSGIPADMTVSTSGFDCDAEVVVPAITAVDDCNPDDIRVDINYEGGFAQDQNGTTIRLSAGISTVNYIVYDVCGNSSTASFNVTVRDLEQPVTICDAFTTVSLNSEGKASLSAQKLDNGSLDECGPVELAIRRMDDDLGFMDEVDFTCADIGPDMIMVALRVTDVSGNANTCMAQVEIQDKIPPVLISGLPDITISCTYPFSMDNLSVFGTVVNNADSVKPIVIDDDAVQFSGPAQDGLILDNCSTAEMSEITSGDLDQCGKGTLIRTITATSPSGESISLDQRITFVNPVPFVESDITWPQDVTVSSCSNDIDPLTLEPGFDYPRYDDGFCDMVSSTFEDQVFVIDECTTKINRTWFVSDWCQRVNNVFVMFEYEQEIVVVKGESPVITSSCDDISVLSTAENCGGAFVDLVFAATSECSDALTYNFSLDFNNDGTIDSIGIGADASDVYPLGTHSVTFNVADDCGNSNSCSYLFTITNDGLPEAICQGTQTIVLELVDTDDDGENDSEKLIIAPSLIDDGSNNSCGLDVTLSFSEDVADQMRMYGCEDVGQQALMLWVTDVNGNRASCITSVFVSDDNGEDFCGPPACECPENDYTGMVVVTCNVDFDSGGTRADKVAQIYDTRQISDAVPGTDWANTPPAADEIPAPNWTFDAIGPVFGIAIDDQANVFLAQSDVYNTEEVFTGNADVSYSPGWIYRAAPPVFMAEPFVQLPNTGGALNGIGNVVYDNENDVLYASNLEDGMLYMIDASGNIVDTFDPFAADDGQPGIVDLAEQIWGIGLNKEGDQTKLYFPQITSSTRKMFSINVTGGTFPASATDIVEEIDNIPGRIPRITDIAFSQDGEKMIFTERGLQIDDFLSGDRTAHIAKTLNYELEGGTWELQLKDNGSQKYYVGGDWIEDGSNSAGGVTFGYPNLSGDDTEICGDSMIWVSGNAINAIRTDDVTRRIYGIQGIDYDGNLSGTVSGGNLDTDIYIDLDGVLGDNIRKGIIGDVELFGCGSQVDGSLLVDVTGSLYTEEDVLLSEVEVFLDGTDLREITDGEGSYSFDRMPMGGDYSVKPFNNIDHRNGVTTLDLILIQKHILGTNTITSPYKLLAADVNNNGVITGTDLLELRKLILGLYEEFPNNTSWRFIDAGYEFVDQYDPWAQSIPEAYDIYNLSSDMKVDFMGLKVGDVNGSVEVQGQPIIAEVRSGAAPFTISYEDRQLKAGEEISVDFYGDSIHTILGYQFTMEVNPKYAMINEVAGATEGFSKVNFGDKYADQGYLTSSWNNVDGQQIKKGGPLFTVSLKVNNSANLSEIIKLTSDITRKEAYTSKGEIIGLELARRGQVEVVGLPELFQNQPNPWIKGTVISFSMPKAAKASLRIFDATGKLVKVHTADYEAGIHKYQLLQEDFSSRGVYYYELITSDYQQSKKMVLIK